MRDERELEMKKQEQRKSDYIQEQGGQTAGKEPAHHLKKEKVAVGGGANRSHFFSEFLHLLLHVVKIARK